MPSQAAWLVSFFEEPMGNHVIHGWVTRVVRTMVFSEYCCVHDFTQAWIAIHLGLSVLIYLIK